MGGPRAPGLAVHLEARIRALRIGELASRGTGGSWRGSSAHARGKRPARAGWPTWPRGNPATAAVSDELRAAQLTGSGPPGIARRSVALR